MLGVIALIIADAQLGRPNAGLLVETKVPRMVGIGAGTITAWLRLTFSQNPPRAAELALEANQFVTVATPRHEAPVNEGQTVAGFRLDPLRRGQARLECAFIRWQGPLGLAWCQRIEPLDLPFDNGGASAASPAMSWDVPPNMTLEDIEKFVIERTLQRTGGNKQKAANMLGIYRPRLYSKIKKYKIGAEAISAN